MPTETADPTPAFLDLTRASQFCGLSPATLRRMAARGELSIYKPGGKVLVNKAELERVILAAREATR
jgi:excisionase family DNA binding protein